MTVHWLFTGSLLVIHWLFIDCTLIFNWLFTDSLLTVYWLFTSFLLTSHWLFTGYHLLVMGGATGRADRTCQEHLVEPSIRELLHPHLQRSFEQILRKAGDPESGWTISSTSFFDTADGQTLASGGPLWSSPWSWSDQLVWEHLDSQLEELKEVSVVCLRSVWVSLPKPEETGWIDG